MASVLFLLLASAASAPAGAVPSDSPPQAQRCANGSSGEIVVCAPRKGPSPYRLPKVSKVPDPEVPSAEVAIAPGTTLGLQLEGSELPGAQGVGMMVKLKIKF